MGKGFKARVKATGLCEGCLAYICTGDSGECVKCGRATASSLADICAACAVKSNKCAYCGSSLN